MCDLSCILLARVRSALRSFSDFLPLMQRERRPLGRDPWQTIRTVGVNQIRPMNQAQSVLKSQKAAHLIEDDVYRCAVFANGLHARVLQGGTWGTCLV